MPNSEPPIYGNYHGYYSKRPFFADPRVQLLRPSMFEGKRVLDVGCNEGYITCQIAQSTGATKVVGVDIDDSLVRAAWRRRRSVWSSQSPGAPPSTGTDAAEPLSKRSKREQSHFPISCEHMFGPLPIPSRTSMSPAFPYNVLFRTADWVEDEIPEDKEGYDVVLALSISKWVHLNKGDSGITRFFERVFSVLKPGGSFVLEYQAWDAYTKAKRVDKRLKENAKGLQLRPEDFESVLGRIGFTVSERLETPDTSNITPGFRRHLDVYKKPSG